MSKMFRIVADRGKFQFVKNSILNTSWFVFVSIIMYFVVLHYNLEEIYTSVVKRNFNQLRDLKFLKN